MLINLTGHKVRFYVNENLTIEVMETHVPFQHIPFVRGQSSMEDRPIQTRYYGIPVRDGNESLTVLHLPEPVAGRYLIVSAEVARACPHRTDLLCCGAVHYSENKIPLGYTELISYATRFDDLERQLA